MMTTGCAALDASSEQALLTPVGSPNATAFRGQPEGAS